jgi:hypothetical protein
VQLIASATTDIAWLLVSGQTVTTGGSTFALDIGVGSAGNEVVVVTNLNYSYPGGLRFFFPCTIPSGSRIAARLSSNTGADNLYLVLHGFQDTYQSAGTGSSIDTYGFNTSLNVGTAVDPGSSINTKGSYVQITASTTADYAGFFFTIDSQNGTGTTNVVAQWLMDIAVGAGGSEVIILPNMFLVAFNLMTLYLPTQLYFPIPIASGSRIAVRSQCNNATSPDRILGVTLYGVRY